MRRPIRTSLGLSVEGCRVWRGQCRVYELTHASHPRYCPSQPRIGLGLHSLGLSTPKAPPDPPQGGLVSPWGAGAKNGRVNWGKLTRRKTPQHLEKQELGPGEGGQSLGSQNPNGAIIHRVSAASRPLRSPPHRTASGFKGGQTAHCAGPGSLSKSSCLQLLVT